MEIQAKDLRIGNYFTTKYPNQISSHLEVAIIHYGYAKHTRGGAISWESIRGITLTEEWLVKLGFERESGESYWVRAELEIQVIPTISGGEMLMMPNARFAKEIKYVHQLQNLYFALTGEELKINPQ